MGMLHPWIIWEMASSVCWKIHCVVHKVHIYYAMATILVACVLLSLLCESTACLVIPGNDIITLLKIHFFGDRVLIHYAMVTILVACVLQSLQNS